MKIKLNRTKKNKLVKIFSAGFLMAGILLLSGCGKTNESPSYKVDLEIWGLFDDSSVYSEIISNYEKANPLVGKITYRKMTEENYQKELINAMAEGNGPDIFLMSNSNLSFYKNKVAPAPDNVFSQSDFFSNFVDVAKDDFVADGKIYAAPLSVDSMQLFYNKDIFNANGISLPPNTWYDFTDVSRKLTKIDSKGEIVQAGVAMGSAYNVNRASDIVSLLMMQNGVAMPSGESSQINFNRIGVTDDGREASASNALGFYTQFSSISSPYYTWNRDMHYSIDAFAEGRAAMLLNYSWNLDTIRSKNAKLNFAVSSIPQYPGTSPVGYANYWAFAVNKSKQAKETPIGGANNAVSNDVRIHEAWQFIKFLTTRNSGTFNVVHATSGVAKPFPVTIDPAKLYLEKTNKPAARRDLIEAQQADPIIKPFALGNLVAKSWYQFDAESVDAIFLEMIDSINKGDASIDQALKLANTRVEQLKK
ncbi:MAG: extracellular solute-binding protein [Candidatus Moranbacteria bacterium]|jgi:ABC-type glycerol-3-phosphate transport system substrate-binding protein|nr:extracellular solute-binding protein [Candidatus Moranbacteria bacterium]